MKRGCKGLNETESRRALHKGYNCKVERILELLEECKKFVNSFPEISVGILIIRNSGLEHLLRILVYMLESNRKHSVQYV